MLPKAKCFPKPGGRFPEPSTRSPWPGGRVQMPGRISQLLTMMRRTKQRTEQDFAGYSTGSSSSSYTSDSSNSDSDDSRPEEEEENEMFRESAVVSRSGKSKKTHSSGKQRHRQNNTSERVPARTCTVQCSSKLGSKHMYNEDTYLATFDIASATKRADATDSMYLPSKTKQLCMS